LSTAGWIAIAWPAGIDLLPMRCQNLDMCAQESAIAALS
jgi:hypothetical protein